MKEISPQLTWNCNLFEVKSFLTRQRHNFFWCLSSKRKMKCVFEKGAHLCVYVLNLTCFEQEKIQPLFWALSIIVNLNAKNDQKIVWSNSHIYVFTSWIWTRFDSFFESKFRICNTILKIFSACNQILVLDHFTDNSVFFKSCVVGGLIRTEMFFCKKFGINSIL